MSQPSRRTCLVDGCSRKDPRIISHRRAAYFASQASANGQTADRIVPAEADSRLPSLIDLDSELSKGSPAMKLSHLLVPVIQNDRETEIARRRLVFASASASSQSASTPSIAKPERWLGRLLPAR